MRKIFTKCLVVALSLVLLVGTLAACSKKKDEYDYRTYNMEEIIAGRAAQLAKATLNTYIDAEIYKDGEIYLYDTFNPSTKETENEASVWHYTSVVAMTNRLAAISTGADKDYFSNVNADLWRDMEFYKGSARILSYRSKEIRSMYAVHRASAVNTANVTLDNAVYDDQMWIIREMLSAYANTGDAAMLSAAETLTDVCLDGWDVSINPETGAPYGGITWGPFYDSKHTCSNAPLIAPLVDLYFIYKDKTDTIYSENKAAYYLNWAKKIYDFSYATFRNSNDLYGDLIGTGRDISTETGLRYTKWHGTLDITQYTYNTGTMIQGGAKLYLATKNANYLTQAQNSAEAAYKIFGAKDEETGISEYPTTSTQWFNFELLLGFVELAYADDSEYKDANKTYVDSFRDALNYAYDNYYHDGILPRNYVKGWMYGIDYDEKKDVMDCAASAEMYALLYQYYTQA